MVVLLAVVAQIVLATIVTHVHGGDSRAARVRR
jgi:hypothetical protein